MERFDIRDYIDFHNKNFLIVVAALLLTLVLLIVVAVNSRHKSTDNVAEVASSTVAAAETTTRAILNADSDMVEQYSKSIANAQNLYQSKKIQFSAFPEYVDEKSGTGIMFLVKSGNNEVRFTCVSQDSDTAKAIMSVDENQEVTITGTVQDVNEREGYVIVLDSIKGEEKTTLPTGSATVTVAPGTSMTTVAEKTNSVTEKTTSASSVMSVRKVKNQYVLYADNAKMTGYTGLVHVSINGVNGYYYFKNGVWQSKWNGIRKMDGKRYMVTDGRLQTSYSGKYILDGVEYTVVNGVIQ